MRRNGVSWSQRPLVAAVHLGSIEVTKYLPTTPNIPRYLRVEDGPGQG
jgi:hypothetical protein